MKKEKLKIDTLKIESFVTEVSKQKEQTVRGGGSVVCTYTGDDYHCDYAHK